MEAQSCTNSRLMRCNPARMRCLESRHAIPGEVIEDFGLLDVCFSLSVPALTIQSELGGVLGIAVRDINGLEWFHNLKFCRRRCIGLLVSMWRQLWGLVRCDIQHRVLACEYTESFAWLRLQDVPIYNLHFGY